MFNVVAYAILDFKTTLFDTGSANFSSSSSTGYM